MFSTEGRFFKFIYRLADLVILNILFIICCIPIITAGASFTALYDVTKKMAASRESYIVRGFFGSFKENFKQSTLMWLLLLFVGIVLGMDLYISTMFDLGIIKLLFQGLVVLAMVVWIFVTIYSLTLQSTFENTLISTLKNALFMSLGHAPWSILMTIIWLSPAAALLGYGNYAGIIFPAMALIWFSLAAYINSFILNHIYKKYM